MSNVKKLLNLNLARFRLKTATLGLITTAAGREFQMSVYSVSEELMSRIYTALFLILFYMDTGVKLF